MKTLRVRDARQCIMGPGGAIVRAMDDKKKAPFVAKAEELGRQIAADNDVDFDKDDVPLDTQLSDEAVRLLGELQSIKDELLTERRVA